MNKKDLFIKEKLKQDKKISEQANDIFEKIKEGYEIENNENKVIKISFNKFLGIAAVIVMVLFVGINTFAYKINKPNLISTIEALIKKDDETDEVAKKLFEDAILAIRDGFNIEYDSEEIKEIDGIYYGKTKLTYSELKEKYEDIFTGEALENALAINAIDVEGIAYIIPKAGPGYFIENINVEKLNQSNGELTYKAQYTKTYVDSNTKEENECQFKIKKINGNYRISATNYLGIDKKQDEKQTEEDIESTTPTLNEMLNKGEADNKEQKETKNENDNKSQETADNSMKIERYLCGDVNCDGEINGKDLIVIKKYIDGQKELTEQGIINADVNDDDLVNQADVEVLRKYLLGTYTKLPQRVSGEKLESKAVPGMTIKYPEGWSVEEIDKETWGNRTGNATCIFRGTVGNIGVTVTTYDPLFDVVGYKNLIKKECLKYGIGYYEGLEENGYNIGSDSQNHLEWRELYISSKLRSYYHIIDKNVDNSLKIEVKIDNPTGENQLPVERIIDDIILGTTVRSY